jgi:alanine racemase
MSKTSTAPLLSAEVPLVPPHANALIEVDLEAIRYNYRLIKSILKPGCNLSAVIKGNAYGAGAREVGKALYQAGCRDFFVINIDEALEVKEILKDSNIYILNGVYEGAEIELVKNNFTPVLLSLEQIALWSKKAQKQEKLLPAILHLDTGIAREGLSLEEVDHLHQHPDLLKHLELKYIMSHLANADEPNNPENKAQLERFQMLCKLLPPAKQCFSNSHGTALGFDYHFDMARPGLGLLGYCDAFKEPHALQPAVTISARILRTRLLKEGQPVGYNALFRAPKEMMVATFNLGYADGLLRSLTNRGYVMIKEYQAPIVGKVSMDYTVIDVSHIPQDLTIPGNWVEIVREPKAFEDLCEKGQTCTYELLARLGRRFHRIYRNEMS